MPGEEFRVRDCEVWVLSEDVAARLREECSCSEDASILGAMF